MKQFLWRAGKHCTGRWKPLHWFHHASWAEIRRQQLSKNPRTNRHKRNEKTQQQEEVWTFQIWLDENQEATISLNKSRVQIWQSLWFASRSWCLYNKTRRATHRNWCSQLYHYILVHAMPQELTLDSAVRRQKYQIYDLRDHLDVTLSGR